MTSLGIHLHAHKLAFVNTLVKLNIMKAKLDRKEIKCQSNLIKIYVNIVDQHNSDDTNGNHSAFIYSCHHSLVSLISDHRLISI